MQELYYTDCLPAGLLTSDPAQLQTLLPGPALIELAGKIEEPLFISVLLHGNEPTGLAAVQALLKKYAEKELPRSLAIFIGNISAAQAGLRRLDDQPDYNRIWPGTEEAECQESLMARQVYDRMRQRRVFASIDVHNNTGLNPHYACINRLDEPFLKLATLFGRLVVYFIRPKGVQSAAFAELCPSVTLECGRPDQKQGIAHVFDFLETCVHLQDFPQHAVRPQDIDLFHTVAQIKVAENTAFSFTDPGADLLLDHHIDRLNFTEIPPGTFFGSIKPDSGLPLIALDEHGKDVSAQFFHLQDNRLVVARSTMPSMLTLNEDIIRQDCLCYMMERLPLAG